jgi:hypothetical protein
MAAISAYPWLPHRVMPNEHRRLLDEQESFE